MKILIVSQYFLPENAFIAPSLARWLTDQGHSVRVLTSFPNYPEGKLYRGWRQRWRQRETIDGAAVLRVPMVIDHSQSAPRRMLNYLSFALSSATARGFARGADVVYVYATQMTPALGPWLWRFTGGAPYVLHVQDLWPDSITGSSLVGKGVASRIIDMVLEPWLRSVYKRSAGIIAIAPRMLSTLLDRGVSAERAHLVFNWARDLPKVPSRPHSVKEDCVAVFAGNVGDMQDLETVVAAAHRVSATRFHLRIVGGGVALDRVKALSDQLGTTNIEFVDRVPPHKMAEIYAEADFSLVTLKNLPVFAGTIPSKFQASLAHGLPIISTVPGDVSDVIRQHDVGFVADPENVDSLEQAFRRAIGQSESERGEMKERAVALYGEAFRADAALGAIERILNGAASRRKRKR